MKKSLLTWSIFIACAFFLICHAPFPKRYYTTFAHLLKKRLQRKRFSPYIHAAFPPRDDVKPLLCGLIDEESEKIDIAMFQFTEKDLAQSLLRAYQRGVEVNLVVYREWNHYSQALTLHKSGVSVSLYPPSDGSRALMHNKYMVLHSLCCIVTGSMNFTQAGSRLNQENVIIMQDRNLYREYANHFDYLRKLSVKL